MDIYVSEDKPDRSYISFHYLTTNVFASLSGDFILQLSDSQKNLRFSRVSKYKSRIASQKCKNRFYHQQKKEDVEFQNVSISFSVHVFHKLPHNNQHYKKSNGVHGQLQSYHFKFDPRLGQGNCEIGRITCAYNACISEYYFPCNPSLCDYKQPRYHLPKHYIYSDLLVELNIITFTNKDMDEK